MALPKTIEAYKEIGIEYSKLNERGYEVAIHGQKELIKNDKNKTEIISNVYRMKVENPTGTETQEVILFDKTTTGHTGLGNQITFWESAQDLCLWLEPIGAMQTRFNPETEETETTSNVEDLRHKTHYLFAFNKENIAMIKEITKNNRRCNFYVKDKSSDLTRIVANGFKDWSTKPFDELLAPEASKE